MRLVRFYTSECPNCIETPKTIAKLAIEFDLDLAEIDIATEEEACKAFRVSEVPCLLLLFNNKEIGRVRGTSSYSSLEKWLDGYL